MTKAAQAMRVQGFAEAQISRWVKRAEKRVAVKRRGNGFLVHPDNVAAVRLLVAMSTQWRVEFVSFFTKAVSVPMGLNYAVLETTARLTGHGEISPVDFARLRILEAEILATYAEQRQ